MSTISGTAATPHYLLLEANIPIGPSVNFPSSAGNSVAVYGFSGKPSYDHFIASSDRDLRPYPLTQGFLNRHAADDSTDLNLVIVDAMDFDQQNLVAVTMKAALKAHQDSAPQLDPRSRLYLQSQSGVYHLTESPQSEIADGRKSWISAL